MIDAFRNFLKDLTGPGSQTPADDGGLRLAAAALLFHTIAIDGEVVDGERDLLREMLAQRFGLNGRETAALITAAGEADAEAIDLYSFTSILKRDLEISEREHIIGMMWRLVYSDSKVHEFEDNTVWRAAELLGVSREARMRLKHVARDDEK
jgi:uncharacterized tellurite resistance protein B-like protein